MDIYKSLVLGFHTYFKEIADYGLSLEDYPIHCQNEGFLEVSTNRVENGFELWLVWGTADNMKTTLAKTEGQEYLTSKEAFNSLPEHLRVVDVAAKLKPLMVGLRKDMLNQTDALEHQRDEFLYILGVHDEDQPASLEAMRG